MFRLRKNFQSLFFFLIFFTVVILSYSFLNFEFREFEKEISQNFVAQTSIFNLDKKTKSVTLMFVGDIMLDRGVKYMVEKYGDNDWNFPFLKIADFLKKADILFGNLEGPISDKGQKVGSIYSFRDDPRVITGLVSIGFDVLSIANNHIFDYGRTAMEDTFSILKNNFINYVGGGFNEIEAYSPIVKEINGTKIAFLAYTNLGSSSWGASDEKSGIAWLNKERLEKIIRETKEKADLTIVSLHFGEEYQFQANSEQKILARLAIDSGASLVIGHHPHVIQEIEKYKDGYIAYSLGNFVFDQGFSEKTMQGILFEILIENNKIKEIIPIEIKINQYFQPEIAE